jgi:NAD(P)-dependent dehydrogenase (short-subunit alcohol dehydrogenase family)
MIGYCATASVDVLELDLSDLSSVRNATARFIEENDRLDLLINNAGVMGTPYLMSADGYELQFATNHLGHFALTGLLLDLLVTTNGSRVVTVSSHGHRHSHLDFDNLQFDHGGYSRAGAYGNSKMANLLFTFELDRRLRRSHLPTIAVAAHPGWTRSALVASGPSLGVSNRRARLYALAARFGGQSTASGALPSLFAATDPGVEGGQYIGPGGLGQLYGPPTLVQANRRARQPAVAERLWAVSEELTGVRFAFDAPADANEGLGS